MFIKPLTKGAVCVLFCTFLTIISTGSAVAINSSVARHSCSSAEKALLAALGLDERVDDSEIIKLLDIPVKRIYASGLIRYRKISSATPKLSQIVSDDKTTIFAKLAAAEALCDFGNKEWINPLKALVTDPNSKVYFSFKIDVAGLLARAGDYSQFELVAKYAVDENRLSRHFAILALGKFCHKSNPVTDRAVGLLMQAATSDSDPWLRQLAMYSLEKIAKVRPEIESKIVDAADANINSPDRDLRITSRAMLLKYRRQPKKD